jgi:hypothetical protein
VRDAYIEGDEDTAGQTAGLNGLEMTCCAQTVLDFSRELRVPEELPHLDADATRQAPVNN